MTMSSVVSSEEEKVRRMINMLRGDIATVVESGEYPPTTVADLVNWAIHAEHNIAKSREDRASL